MLYLYHMYTNIATNLQILSIIFDFTDIADPSMSHIILPNPCLTLTANILVQFS